MLNIFFDGFLPVFNPDDSSPDQISQLYYRIFISLLAPQKFGARIEGHVANAINLSDFITSVFFAQGKEPLEIAETNSLVANTSYCTLDNLSLAADRESYTSD